MVGAILYPLLAVYLRQQRFRAVVWFPVIIGLEIFLFLMFRTRTFPVMHAFGLLVGWFVIAPRMEIARSHSKRPLRMRLTAVQKTSIIALVVALVMGMFVLRVFRGDFEKANSLSEIEIDIADSVQYAFEGRGELGYSKWVFKILEIVPERHDYMYGQSYYRLLFLPIPRSLWPEKPRNSQIIVAQWIDPGALSVQSTPVGIFGDLYVNFGFWGILGMLVFGYAFGLVDRGRRLTYTLFLAVSFAMVFHMARGGFTNPLIVMVVFFVMAKWVANYLCQGTSV